MRLPWYDIPRMLGEMRRIRRALSVAACLGVVAWMLLFATHFHGPDAEPRTQTSVCVLCLSMPAGAAPPAQIHIPALFGAIGPPVEATALSPQASRPFLAYLSRGPPVA
jgi:hypothetical protein